MKMQEGVSYIGSWPPLSRDGTFDNGHGRNAIPVDFRYNGSRNSKTTRNSDSLMSSDDEDNFSHNGRKNKKMNQRKGRTTRTSSHHLLPCRGLIACSACSYPECHFLHDSRFIGCTSTLVHARKWPDGDDIFFYYGEEDNGQDGYHVPWSYSTSPRQQQRATFSMISHLVEHLCNHRRRDVKFEQVVDGPDIAFNRYLGNPRLSAFRNMSSHGHSSSSSLAPLSSCLIRPCIKSQADAFVSNCVPSGVALIWKSDDDSDSDSSSECTTVSSLDNDDVSIGIWSPLAECMTPLLPHERRSGSDTSEEDNADCGGFELDRSCMAPSLRKFLSSTSAASSSSCDDYEKLTDQVPSFLHAGSCGVK